MRARGRSGGGLMRCKVLLAALIVVSVCGVSAQAASASTSKPTITSFSPGSGTVGIDLTIIGTNLTGATKVTFNGTVATVISDHSKEIEVFIPVGVTTGIWTVALDVPSRGWADLLVDG